MEKESYFLTIFNTNKSDCGKFNLVAFNSTGEIWHSFNLLVRGIAVKNTTTHINYNHTDSGTRREEHPPEILNHPSSREHPSGELVEMVCQVQGYPEPRVEFYRQGRLISCNENNNIGREAFGYLKSLMFCVQNIATMESGL